MAARPIELVTEDRVVLRGIMEGDGTSTAMLFHDVGADLDELRPLTASLVEAGFRVLALDFRGHGASEGDWSVAGGIIDARTTLAVAEEAGAANFFAVAAGDAAAVIMAAQLQSLDAAIFIAPVIRQPLHEDELRAASWPKLLMVGSDDQDTAGLTKIERQLLGPRTTVSLPCADHADELLSRGCVPQVLSHARTFLVNSSRKAPLTPDRV